jgi:hypothetical protein
LVSGLGPQGGPDRSLTLTLTGRLDLGPRESCTCCGEELGVLLRRELHAGIC